jgi:hypothetical protein
LRCDSECIPVSGWKGSFQREIEFLRLYGDALHEVTKQGIDFGQNFEMMEREAPGKVTSE